MKLGTNDISSVYLGTNAVQKVYLGTNEVWSSFTGLLDTYTGAAAAYSLRKLRSAYTGSAIRVRRISDNTEQNIGFVNNVLDTSSLTSFCSGTNGFVTTWYDQSGNGNDAIQTTAANQPQIVSSGSVITQTYNSTTKPTIDFNEDQLDFNNAIGKNTGYVFIKTVTSITGGSSYRALVELQTNNARTRSGIFGRSTTNNEFGGRRLDSDSYQFFNSSYNINQGIIGAFFDYSNAQLYGYINSNIEQKSGGFQTSGLTSNTDSAGNRIGNSGGSRFIGKISEIVIYLTDESTNNNGINTNINDFYSIY